MFKIVVVSSLMAVVAGVGIGLLGNAFALSAGALIGLSALSTLAISFFYTAPSIKALALASSSGGSGVTKVS